MPILSGHVRCIHDLETLGFPVHTQVMMKAASQIANHCLECTGVVCEQPTVVNPAEVRKNSAIHLLVVVMTADDVPRFFTVPLFGECERWCCMSSFSNAGESTLLVFPGVQFASSMRAFALI